MQTNAINSLFKLSEKTTFLQNWRISKRIDTPCRKKSYTLDSLPNHSFVKKASKPICQETLSNSIITMDKHLDHDDRPKKKKYVPMIKHKMHPKKILESFLQKSLVECADGDAAYNIINLYHPVKQTSEKLPIFEQCFFSNSRIIESLCVQANANPFKSDDPKQYSRCFQSCLIKQQKSYSKLKRLQDQQKSAESVPVMRDLTSKLRVRGRNGNNFICRRRDNKKYFLDIVQQ